SLSAVCVWQATATHRLPRGWQSRYSSRRLADSDRVDYMSKTYTYFAVLVGAVCVYFLVRLLFFIDLSSRTVQSDVVQGVLIGFGMAFVSAQIYARINATKVNGWITMFVLGEPSNVM